MNTNKKTIVVALLAGVLIGGLLGRFSPVGRYLQHPPSPERMQKHMLKKFSSALHLSNDQKEKIGAILKTSHEQMKALRDETTPKFDAIREATATQIRSLLTPEQLVKFNDMHEKHQRRAKKDGRFTKPRFF